MVHVYPICTPIVFKCLQTSWISSSLCQGCVQRQYAEARTHRPAWRPSMQDVNCMLGRRLRCSGLVACQHCRTVPGSEPWKHATCRGTLVDHDWCYNMLHHITPLCNRHFTLSFTSKQSCCPKNEAECTRHTSEEAECANRAWTALFIVVQRSEGFFLTAKSTPLRCDSSSLSKSMIV